MNKARTDLNLLAVFDAVAKTGSVSKAAHLLALSQPAVSHALNRLRDVTGDRLFVRGKSALVPTPRAEKMMTPVANVLKSAREALAGEIFDPRKSSMTFRIGVSDYALLTSVPHMVRALRKEAPQAGIELTSVDDRTLERLEAGTLDCTFWGAKPPQAPFEKLELYQERFIGVVSDSHPLARKTRRKKIALTEYLAYPHAMVKFGDARPSPVAEALAKLGHERQIAITAPGFGGILALLPNSNLIASLPTRLVEMAGSRSLRAFELPFEVAAFAYALVWHKRKSNDPANSWLRTLIAARCGL